MEQERVGSMLNICSFDFTDNNRFFHANNFQPSRDRPYVDMLLPLLNVRHTKKYYAADDFIYDTGE